MGRIGVSPEEWNSAVTSAATQVTNVKGATVKELQKTTLNRFKSLIEMQKKIETTLTSYKGYNTTSTNKMKEVAQKIVEEDAQYGANFQKNTANLRFK
ncbi:hypothetical protein SGODD07_01579 [Streptococcus gordonii]|uniref:TIGR04197 family type VII secretion effector n=1 Tax=Streptococcus gordonii TaxID=1302 RepID=A0A139N2W3_STRGN|nr:hypothetical protein SGODD07_01579 [Streptococcus gordonii]